MNKWLVSSPRLGKQRGLAWFVLFPSAGVVVECLQMIGARYPIYSVGLVDELAVGV